MLDKTVIRTGLPLAIILSSLLAGCAQSATPSIPTPTDAGAAFSIHLVKRPASAQEVSALGLEELEVGDAPFLSIDDIVTYDWGTHEIELTAAGYERVAHLDVPVTTGVPFVVRVGAERIYSGAFWVGYSSMSFNGIVIDKLPATNNQPLRIQLGYPESSELFVGEDARSDSRIRHALEDAGTLK
jgi:hypothetical protein